jgi:hypothetical protein
MSGADVPRTVTDDRGDRPDVQMSVVGILVAVGTAVVLLPVAPFLAVAWLVARDRENEYVEGT